jgi:DNA-binding HxlR family transcriptional regulator
MLHCERTARLQLVIEVISDKWRIAVLHSLLNGPVRTSQLRKELPGVSAKMLTQTVRGMERDGLVDRRIYAGVPPRVEYLLTDVGRYLHAALDGLSFWCESYGQETLLARRRYDARPQTFGNKRRSPGPLKILGGSTKPRDNQRPRRAAYSMAIGMPQPKTHLYGSEKLPRSEGRKIQPA